MVPVRTPRTQRAVALHESFACWLAWIQAEAVFAPQEIAEVEVVHGLPNLV